MTLVVGYYKSKGIKVKNIRGKYDLRLPGDEVPEAETWPENVLQSNMNQKWLQSKDHFEATKKSAIYQAGVRRERREAYQKNKDEGVAVKKTKEAMRKSHNLPVEKAREDYLLKSAEAEQETADEKSLEQTGAEAPKTEPEELVVEHKSDDPLDMMKKPDLQDLARSLKVAVRGTNKQLIERIRKVRAN